MTGPAVTPNPKADLWDAFIKAGLPADSATKSVNAASDAGMSNADAYDHFVLGKAAPSTGTPGVDPTRPAQGFFDHVADATTFGLGKKAMAAIQSLGAGHGLSDYDANLARTNHDLTAESAANPKTAMAGSLTGAVVSPINKLLAPLGLIGGGAVGGALAGSGASKDDLSSQVKGAGAGAIGGGLFGGLAKGAATLLGPSTGERLVANAANDPAVKAHLAELTAAGRGPQTVLADLSPRLNGILDRAANRNPDVMDAVQKVVSSRQPDAAGRVMNDMTDAVGNPHAAQLADNMKSARLQWAAGPNGFQGLRDANPSLPANADLAAVLKRPGMQDALDLAMKADKLDGTTAGGAISRMFGQGGLGMTGMTPVGSTPPVSYQTAAQLERLLDGKAGTAFKSGDVPLAQAYKTLRNGVGDFLESAVPEHAAVKAQYAGMKANEEALTAGAQAWKNPSARDVAAEFTALTPEQQNLYRKGLASSAIDQLGNRNTNLDAAAPLTNASASTQAKLKLIFGDQPTFDKFMQNAQAERTLSRLNAIPGGSATARRGGDDGTQVAGALMRGATSLAHGRGITSSLLHIAAPSLQNAMRNQTAVDAGPLLTTQGPDAIAQLLAKMQGTQQSMGLLTQGALGGSNLAGRLGGLLGQ